MSMSLESIQHTLANAKEKLLAARVSNGHWEGRLSSSALSTATPCTALALLDRTRWDQRFQTLVDNGLTWLAEHQNDDGGWGDTVDSPSNISTTALCWAALGLSVSPTRPQVRAVDAAEAWLTDCAGELTPESLARAIVNAYGKDRTFSVPILTMCALTGRLGSDRKAWELVPPLPFELAAFPRRWFRWLGLNVVSYALPALIAIGQTRHHYRPTRNPITRLFRNLTRAKTLEILHSIQPTSGGFLEATPLTSFVVMCLASIGQADHPVADLGATFLETSVREDGSWPIDTNLATWVSTLSVNALAGNKEQALPLSSDDRSTLMKWLLGQQYRRRHPYTGAAPGGWAWTDLPGGVPDADDTAGALLALWHLASQDPAEADGMIPRVVDEAATAGTQWLLNLQNKDGGIPTFCHGWGKLPFDRSSPDLTAHALRAWHVWRGSLPTHVQRRVRRAIDNAIKYLVACQRSDGTWVPLWFGNQKHPDKENPLYGTARVLQVPRNVIAEGDLARRWLQARQRAADWMLTSQNANGGWGGSANMPSSIEETSLAVEALTGLDSADSPTLADTIQRGCAWLVKRTESGTTYEPSPIGLYFARLWYHEELYPLIFTVAALERTW